MRLSPSRLLRVHLIAVIVLITGAGHAAAQKVSYDFSVEQGTYQELQGAVTVPLPLGDTITERYNVGINGETFNFFRRPYTITDSSGIQISSMGYIRVENDTSMVIIDGIFGSLVPRDASSRISYLIEGEPGDRIVKAEWKNAGFFTGGAENFTNFQIWIYQRSGMIEIRTGEGYAPRLDTIGAWMGVFLAPLSFQYMIEKLWIAGRPSRFVLDSSRTIFFQILKELPPSGAIIRLTPRQAASSVEGEEEVLDLRLTSLAPLGMTTRHYPVILPSKEAGNNVDQITEGSGRAGARGKGGGAGVEGDGGCGAAWSDHIGARSCRVARLP